MSYTFLNMQDKLSSLLGDSNSDTDSQFPLADRKKEINNGEIQFAVDAKNLREYETGTVSGNEISVPTGFLEIYILILTIGGVKYVITKEREISIRDIERYNTSTGTPPYYYFWEFSGTRKIKFLGSGTGSTYELYYYKKPTTDLSADSDTSVHPEEFRQASVYWAASQLLLQIGQYQRASALMQFYERFVDRAKIQIAQQTVNHERPNPDFNLADYPITDRQGGGWM